MMPADEPISLLFVDDEEAILRAYETYLRDDPGFSVTVCRSADEALDILATRQFDAIISDIAMPDMDGLAFLRAVRSREIPALFIVITGKRLAHIAIDAINAGADYYVQKSTNFLTDFRKMQDFIRVAVPRQRALLARQGRSTAEPAGPESTDILCRFSPDGTIRSANGRYHQFFGGAENTLPGRNFFSLIPETERSSVISHLRTLLPAHSGKILEHNVMVRDGSLRLLQWHYQSIAGEGGRTAGFQVLGRETGSIVRIGSAPAAAASPRQPDPAALAGDAAAQKQEAAAPDHATAPAAPRSADATPNDRRMIEETVNGLDSPAFAIDRNGVVIAWNSALEQLTGTDRKSVVGQGGHACALPFYGRPVPMLADYVFCPPIPGSPGHIDYKKMGDTFIGDTEHVAIQGRPMLLWGKAAATCDAAGAVVAAVEIVTVADPETTGQGDERYIGGISSLTLKVSGEGAGSSIAGAIGASTGGYGIYATTARVFVIRNPDLDVTSSDRVNFGTFIMSEFFGTMVDTSPRTIDSLEKAPVFMADKDTLAAIDLKKPVMLSGSVTFRTKDGGSFRVYIDHKKSYVPVEELMKTFAPEIVHAE